MRPKVASLPTEAHYRFPEKWQRRRDPLYRVRTSPNEVALIVSRVAAICLTNSIFMHNSVKRMKGMKLSFARLVGTD